MGRKIKTIKARLISIGSEAKAFNLVERDRPMEISFMTKKRQLTHSFVPKDKIIGRGDDKAALLKLVLEFESEETVYIIPIVGFGGLGKTALAQFVYNDGMAKHLIKISKWTNCKNNFGKKLVGKKYLLVLDDIWNEEWEKWVSLKELLVGGAKGSRIIVTTRSLGVAKITSKCQPYVLKGLSDNDAWSLFKEIAFEQRSADSTDSGFVKIGKLILERCCGVPLVIRTIAGTLSFKETKSEWLSFKDNELARISQNEGEILPTLKLSYDHLSSHLKHCFAYCRLYPKDHEIDMILPKSICKIQNLLALKLDWCTGLEELPKKIEKLVNLTHLSCCYCWELTHMPRGIGKLTSLETLSMFVVDKDGSHGGADLSELRLLNNLRGGLGITNLGFVKNAKEKFKAANFKEKQHLRSLLLEWKFYFDFNDDEYDDYKSLEDLQPHHNLKELCIRGWRSDAKFPSWLSFLTNLVYMTIHQGNFKQIPSFVQFPCLKGLVISNLTELEYMDDNSPKGSQGEPQSFFPSLKHLSLRYCPNMMSWWRTTKPIDDDSNEDDTTVMGTSTMGFPCLSSLTIENCPLTSMPLYPSLDEDLMLSNTSSRPLKQTIKMNINAKAPLTSTSSLPLSKLKSFDVHKIEGLDTHTLDECLQHLTSLKRLTIRDCKEVDLEGMQWEPLKNTSHLKIDNIPKLVSLPISLQHLVQLKTLEIRECHGLRSLFPVFQHLTFLEEFEVKDCKDLELSGAGIQIFQDHTSLRSLWLENIPKCRHLPEWPQHLTNLQGLYLVNLPNLTSLPDEMRCLTSLEYLNIGEIPQLVERRRKDIGADWHKIAHIPNIGLIQEKREDASEYLVVRLKL
ncbi:hypothetical protein GOBAR_DD35655 [Gossypium barbadense]|nr:hypothetical protein GOBAR_DD35655 [Gossypium barbadense]